MGSGGKLEIVASFPDFFAMGGREPVKRGVAFGCSCARCQRVVAAPFGFESRLIWCLYCGMECGFVPMVETEFWHRYRFGITREECIEDRRALADGSYYQMAEARARREGRLLDLSEW